MRYFNLLIISIVVFSSCVFSGKPKQAEHEVREVMGESRVDPLIQYGDSITVDTVIGDFRLYYKVSDVVDTSLIAFSCNEDATTNEIQRIDKRILLNIQMLDTTSVVHKKVINIHTFQSVLPQLDDRDYLIESFSLVEVMPDYVAFESKLCRFGTDICHTIKVQISKDGRIVYTMQQ